MLQLVVTHTISDQDVIDLMVTAIEGGINYWCPSIQVQSGTSNMECFSERVGDIINKGGTILLADDEDETHDLESYTWHELTADKLRIGFQKYLERKGSSVDPGDWDVEVADVIIQLAIFGKIVYG